MVQRRTRQGKCNRSGIRKWGLQGSVSEEGHLNELPTWEKPYMEGKEQARSMLGGKGQGAVVQVEDTI